MIDRAYVTEWQLAAPWPQRYQVEQDLIICRALVEIFNHPLLAEQLAFRGGTALFSSILLLPAIPKILIWCKSRPAQSVQ